MHNQRTRILSTTASSILSSTRKSRLNRADALIKRWAWLVRGGLPDVGYPHRSPEQSLAGDTGGGHAVEIMPEDDLTAETINSMSLQLRNVARLHWSIQLTDNQIAQREKMSRKMVRTRIRWIKEQVADKCLY